MLIKNKPLVINDADPFSSDKLNRKDSASILTNLITFVDEPFVMAIDSAWGTGKTTFIQMWSKYLLNNGFHTLYYNAWENDYADDPLISFIGEIQSKVDSIRSELGEERYSKAKEYLENAKKIGSSVAKQILPVAAKIATAGIVDLDKITDSAISDLMEKLVKQKIDNYESDKQTVKSFQKNIEELLGIIEQREAGAKKPLVFFIDELDRCRPTYAIELLERLKHLFNVKGIIFVLSIDKEQITHSIRSIYGIGMDAEGYLRRFIDLEYSLPLPSTESFCNYLYDNFCFEDYFSTREVREKGNEKGQLLLTFTELSNIFKLSLRDQEQCFTRFSLVLKTTQKNHLLYPIMLAFLIVVKISDNDTYTKYIKQIITADEVINIIKNKPDGEKFLWTNYGIAMEAFIVGGFLEYGNIKQTTDKYTTALKDEPSSSKLRDRAGRILSVIETLAREDHYTIVNYLVSKIEVAERFII
ncbi:P-loop NTPase fold protein [Candidatus Deferrimicrobium sp.]|uniref:KAP family P-loop NTPase fold protein n=1 Tax=Candidatus Deferrimicrobium sp. TaxID=3060586 RepID=UPI00271D8AE6|nr:P-loop NTPase fold protein [Candidatus Deferrimicrobium sp.]MDO8738943.1 P-loop NTPase fold protein [Candidatus Deferrimicrobium sp.]